MRIKSNITGVEYTPENVVWYRNITQIALYIENGAQVVDVNAQGGRLAIAFWKEEHRLLKPLWDAKELRSDSHAL